MLKGLIQQRALEMGFDLVGIAPIAIWEDLRFSRQWVERGYGGEMRYLENPQRDDPRLVMPSAKSVICAGLVYNVDLPYSNEVGSEKLEAGRQESGVRSQEAVGGRQNTGTSRQKEDLTTPIRQLESKTSHLPQTTSHLSDDGARAWISRYAWGADYHAILRNKLEDLRSAVEALAPGVETRVYVDTGPIVERAFARLSGIGWMGKNTCLINESKGSWFFLGVILTSLDLSPDLPAPDRCGSCTRCLEACPTGALVEPYVMDASRCISYFTIELKGSIPEEFRPAIGANIFGCDICQDVCPWNERPSSVVRGPLRENHQPSAISSQRREAATTHNPEFRPMRVNLNYGGEPAEAQTQNPEPRSFFLFNPALQVLASLTEGDFRRIFRHSPVKRVNYRGWLRNLCVAVGNSGDAEMLPHVRHLREHADPIVREHAEWAIERLTKARPAPEFDSAQAVSQR